MRALPNINPTPEQLAILADDAPGYRLIRGAAGSGKTSAALLRLRQLCASRLTRRERLGRDEPVRVLVLTFNRTLRGYVEQLASEQIAPPKHLHLTIETFGGWAQRLVGQVDVIDAKPQIKELLGRIGISPADMVYFVDEIDYALGRFLPDERENYLDAVRAGRGRAPAVARRLRTKLLEDVIAPYEAWKLRHGHVDWNDVALKAAFAISPGYDIVVVDEIQDFSANQLRAVLPHLKPDHVTTFIIDAVQRIYPRSFQWAEIGISMRPQLVFTLNRNHRNTREIARFAASLVRDLPPEDDGTVPDEEACLRVGRRPEVITGPYRKQLDRMLDRIRPLLNAGETVAILQPRGGKWFDFARNALRRRDIPFCELTQNRDWPTGPELLALSTIHSAKGLEFDHVLLPGLDREVTPHGVEAGDGTLESLRRLLAMGIGRARCSVSLGYRPGSRSTLIDVIDSAIYDLVEV